MKWRSLVPFLLGLALLASVLAACGGASAPQNTADSGPDAEEPAEVEVTRIVEGQVEATIETETVIVTATPEPQPFSTEQPMEEPTEEVAEEEAEEEPPAPVEEEGAAGAQATEEPDATQEGQQPLPPVTTATVAASPPALPSPTLEPLVEERLVEVEWPARMALGNSDLIRLSLVPSVEGYTVTTEFPDNQTTVDPIAVEPRAGYTLSAAARLEAAGMAFAPQGEQRHTVTRGDPLTWRWTVRPPQAGRHRLFITLSLQWTPEAGTGGTTHQAQIWSKPLEIEVHSFMGMTTQQAGVSGLFGLVAGSVLSLPMMTYLLRSRPRAKVRSRVPNAQLRIEKEPAFVVTDEETTLLRALFAQYARLVLKAEFRSGYSGARIFLALPIHADGRADAYTIVKLGERGSIEREADNYQAFVKHTLPPITARIEDEPVVVAPVARSRREGAAPELAALRYTFIGEPGQMPRSLRQALLDDPDPALLEKLFRVFGPNWWLQRRPYTFRLAEEYDRNLPSHFVLEPAPGSQPQGVLDGRHAPEGVGWGVGDVVTLRDFSIAERRRDRGYLSLVGAGALGHPPLRVRWRGLEPPRGVAARVVATRAELLRGFVEGFDLLGLPDPLDRLRPLLNEQLSGTRSTIHGDLNLENVLLGPSDLVWLIDFAQTREGHALADFAHLEAELIAHVLAPQLPSAEAYLALFRAGTHPLLATVHQLAARCLFNPDAPREYDLALYVTCLGALKYANLTPFARHLLFLTAAEVAERL